LGTSGAVKAGYPLVTGLLVLALGFGAFTIASVGVGLARHGDSLLYGDTLTVPLELSPDEFAPPLDGLELRGWPNVTAEVKDPTSKQMFLSSARDFGTLVLFVVGLWLLRGFLRSVMEGGPFGTPNVQRLRRIGFLLVLGAPAIANPASCSATSTVLDWGRIATSEQDGGRRRKPRESVTSPCEHLLRGRVLHLGRDVGPAAQLEPVRERRELVG
jgi:hypothetical protein